MERIRRKSVGQAHVVRNGSIGQAPTRSRKSLHSRIFTGNLGVRNHRRDLTRFRVLIHQRMRHVQQIANRDQLAMAIGLCRRRSPVGSHTRNGRTPARPRRRTVRHVGGARTIPVYLPRQNRVTRSNPIVPARRRQVVQNIVGNRLTFRRAQLIAHRRVNHGQVIDRLAAIIFLVVGRTTITIGTDRTSDCASLAHLLQVEYQRRAIGIDAAAIYAPP